MNRIEREEVSQQQSYRDAQCKDTSGTKIMVFDTTLRDGQQCPGAGMSFEKNIEYFELSCAMRIDILEAGFPAASALDFDIVHAIAQRAATKEFSPVIAGLCQLREEQVQRTIEALRPAIPMGRARLHTYVPVDPELMSASLGSIADEKNKIAEDVYRLIKMAVDAGLEVQFSPEGYSRMRENFDFTTQLILKAVEAGATIINCPDTIGGSCTLEGDDYFVEKMKMHAEIVRREFPDKNVTWSVHCHNDFGLAVQNTINAVFEGPATQIEGCINGIGERAGNASLEQCIMIIREFGRRRQKAVREGRMMQPSSSAEFGGDKDYERAAHARGEQSFAGHKQFFSDINIERMQTVSDFVSANMLPRQPHWPVTGDNAARHSSGGHTNAILKNPMAYQPFDPRQFGKDITFSFGPLSGGNHARSIIESFGFICEDKEKAKIAQFIKDRSKERRKGISDRELMKFYFQFRQPMQIDSVDYSRRGSRSAVRVTGRFFGREGTFNHEHSGNDSALHALKKMIEGEFGEVKIISHSSRSDSEGIEAKSISQIVIESNDGNQFAGQAEDRDIEISAMRALIDAVNQAYVCRHYSVNGTTSPFANAGSGMMRASAPRSVA